jgi:hypothetical protein
MSKHKPRALMVAEPTIVAERHPDELPARVIYSLSKGGVVAVPGVDPDMPKPDFVVLPNTIKGKLANGLTVRADAMARMVARGIQISDAFRTAYAVRYGVNPRHVASRAHRVVALRHFCVAVDSYKRELREEGAQRVIPIKGFVMGRLVHEAQSAENDGARVRSLELLGKTEGMFTDVKRVEHVDDRKIDELKQRLSERLSEITRRFGLQSPSQGEEPHHPSAPLIEHGSHPGKKHINPSESSELSGTPGVSAGSIEPSELSGTPLVEMTLADLGVGGTYKKSEDGYREVTAEDLGL